MTSARFQVVHWFLLVVICGLPQTRTAVVAGEPSGPPAQQADQISYYKQIRPIFQTHCQGCHQPAKPSGDYVMTGHEQLLAAGESGSQAIVPGKPDESFLVAQITPVDGSAPMPKEKPPLADAERELVSRWIAEGAVDDTPESARPQFDMDHPPTYVAPPVITSLDFSPDGELLAVSGYHEVVLHKTDGSGIAARLVGLSERIESAVFSPDGHRLAVTGGSPGRMGEVQVWDVPQRQLLLALPVGYDTVYGASWSHDGSHIAFGCPDNSLRAINAETGEQTLFNGAHNDWVLDTIFSVKSDHLVTVSRDMSMKLIKVDTQRYVDNITSITPGALKGGLNAVDRHPQKDELVCGGADGVPKIYRMYREKDRKIGDDFNLIRALDPMPGRVNDVSYSSDGERIIAGSSYNGAGQMRLYDANSGEIILEKDIPESGIYAVAITPDGHTIAAAGFDGIVRLYNVSDGKLLRKFTPVPLTAQTATAAVPQSN